MELELLLPKRVNEIAFHIIRRMFYESGFLALLPDFGVAFAEREEPFLFYSLDNQ